MRAVASACSLTDGAGTSPANGDDLELDGASRGVGEVPVTASIGTVSSVSDVDAAAAGRCVSGVVDGVTCAVGCFKVS